MAPTGHTHTQEPQRVQAFVGRAIASSTTIASAGQLSLQ
jgi:hypothetical protein